MSERGKKYKLSLILTHLLLGYFLLHLSCGKGSLFSSDLDPNTILPKILNGPPFSTTDGTSTTEVTVSGNTVVTSTVTETTPYQVQTLTVDSGVSFSADMATTSGVFIRANTLAINGTISANGVNGSLANSDTGAAGGNGASGGGGGGGSTNQNGGNGGAGTNGSSGDSGNASGGTKYSSSYSYTYGTGGAGGDGGTGDGTAGTGGAGGNGFGGGGGGGAGDSTGGDEQGAGGGGGGAGIVAIVAGTLSGTGKIQARGGNGGGGSGGDNCGGGGGGGGGVVWVAAQKYTGTLDATQMQRSNAVKAGNGGSNCTGGGGSGSGNTNHGRVILYEIESNGTLTCQCTPDCTNPTSCNWASSWDNL